MSNPNPNPDPNSAPPPPPPVGQPGQPNQYADPANPRDAAIARLHRKRAFWIQVGGWVIGCIFFTIIWALSGGGGFWPIWIIAVGILVLGGQAWAIFGQKPISEADIQREMKNQ